MSTEDNQVPEKISKEYLDALSENISGDQLAYLFEVTNEKATKEIRESIESQMLSEEKIFDDLSRYQYFEQEIKVNSHMSITLRTIEASSNDEAIKFSLAETKSSEANYDLFWRIRNRKRLSYALKALNGKPICAESIDGSYVELMMSGVDVGKEIERISSEVYKIIKMMPEIYVERINNYFMVWENMVYERIRNCSLDKVIKN